MRIHPSDQRTVERRPWLIPLGLTAAAFVLRLVFLLDLRDFPLLFFPTMDEAYHVSVAKEILSGTLPAEPYYRAPGYLYLLALLFKFTGHDLFWSRFLQIILGAATPALTYLIGRHVVSKPVALAAGVVATLYPTLIYFDTQLLLTGLKVLLVCLLVWQLYRTQARPEYREFVLAGLILGLAGLARPNILLAGPALAVWAVIELRPKFGWPGATKRFAVMGLAAVLTISPVTIRNYVVGHDPVFIAWQGGFNFFLGNNAQASGWSATAPGIDPSWMGGYRQAIAIAEDYAGHSLKRSEVSDYWYDRAWDDIRRSPGTFFGLMFKKLRLFFNGYEIPNNQDTYLARDYAWLLRPLLWNEPFRFPYGLLAPLAVVGLVLTFRQWRRFLLLYLVMAAYIGSFLVFFVCDRYRQPMIPLFILLAAFGVSEIVHMARQRDYRKLGVLAVLFVALLVESNHDMLKLSPQWMASINHSLIGKAYLEQGSTMRAAAEFSKAIAIDPTNAEARNNFGMMEARRGNRQAAEEQFALAIKYDPTEMSSYFNLATARLEAGDPASAIATLERAREIRPYDDFVHLKLAMTYLEVGRLQDAWTSVNRSLSINAGSDLAVNMRNQILQVMRANGIRPQP